MNGHTRDHEPTIGDLLERIDQLERKLAPEPPPSLSDLLREQANEQRAKNTLTLMLDDTTRKEGA